MTVERAPGRGSGYSVRVLLTAAAGLLPSAAATAAPPDDGVEARIEYARSHGSEHPARAVDALLGAFATEAEDDDQRREIARRIDEAICKPSAHAALCDETELRAALAEWKPRRRARVRKRPSARPPARPAPRPAPGAPGLTFPKSR